MTKTDGSDTVGEAQPLVVVTELEARREIGPAEIADDRGAPVADLVECGEPLVESGAHAAVLGATAGEHEAEPSPVVGALGGERAVTVGLAQQCDRLVT